MSEHIKKMLIPSMTEEEVQAYKWVLNQIFQSVAARYARILAKYIERINEDHEMKLGTQIKFKDGRVATVVYNSLIGAGIKWGLHNPKPEDFEGTDGNTFKSDVPDGWEWEPEALLRDPWPNCEENGFTAEQCVGTDYEVTRKGGAL